MPECQSIKKIKIKTVLYHMPVLETVSPGSNKRIQITGTCFRSIRNDAMEAVMILTSVVVVVGAADWGGLDRGEGRQPRHLWTWLACLPACLPAGAPPPCALRRVAQLQLSSSPALPHPRRRQLSASSFSTTFSTSCSSPTLHILLALRIATRRESKHHLFLPNRISYPSPPASRHKLPRSYG